MNARAYLTSDSAELSQDDAPFARAESALGPFDFQGETTNTPPILHAHLDRAPRPLGIFESMEYVDGGLNITLSPPPRLGQIGNTAPPLTRVAVAPFKNRQRIALPGGRIATVEGVHRNRAIGTAAYGAWMVEARPDGIDAATGKHRPIETHFARECRQ